MLKVSRQNYMIQGWWTEVATLGNIGPPSYGIQAYTGALGASIRTVYSCLCETSLYYTNRIYQN